jgi:diadenosine tetraphosphate (Ap4A) HIT family hydrolase
VTTDCEICRDAPNGELWRDRLCRVIRVEDQDHPVFYRVIAAEHVREMTDLNDADRIRMMRVVFAVEGVVRRIASPLKMNLASLGNVCPHVHWHVIARWEDDRHFPAPIWAAPKRDASPRRFEAGALAVLDQAVVASLNELSFDNVTPEIRS